MTGSRARVVLADDTPDVRLLLRLALERTGDFEIVGEARDGREAVALATELQPDALVLDLAMPNMDGLEALPEIKEHAPETKVLVLSGLDASEMSAEAHRKGADAYLEKGASTPDIIDTLDTLCALERASSRQAPVPPVPRREEPIYGLVHEMSTPVTAIAGFADAIEHAVTEPSPELRQAIDAIRRNATHLRMLLSAFTDARRIEIDALDLTCATVGVCDLVRETAFDMQAVTGARPVDLRVKNDGKVELDPTRIRQALINLLSNAAKFSAQDAPIEISVDVGQIAEIVVTDHGRGIAREDRARLFGKFTRLHHGGPGSGLGLYISRGIAKAHGGDLELVSSSPEGSSFRLWVPVQ